MILRSRLLVFVCCLLPAALLLTQPLQGQSLLERNASVEATHRPLGQVLADIARRGSFYFSYNSDLVPADSSVTLTLLEAPLRDILSRLLGPGYDFRETGRYVIIRPAAGSGPYVISGYVVDKVSGARIPEASVYEARQLVSSMTDAQGYFRLRLHAKYPDTRLRVGRYDYNDTALVLLSGHDQTLTLAVTPITQVVLDSVTVTPYGRINGRWFGRFFISSRQKVQDLNLSRFFADKPFQYSVVPGVGTHGRLSAQVTNNFSFNILGGYAAGSNGFELGGLFNIDKKNVQYVQIAGLVNSVGGKARGAQVAGLYNTVLDSVSGAQVAGLINRVGGSLTGVEVGGLFNRVEGPVAGVMVSGLFNYTDADLHGLQFGGLFNRAHQVKGSQIAGLFNRAAILDGFQLGLVNVADSSTGTSIGLVNIVRHGYRGLALSWNEALDINLGIRTGREQLYGIILAGMALDSGTRTYSLGYGLGKLWPLSRSLAMTTEASWQGLYQGSWYELPSLVRLQPALQFRLGHGLALYGGPALALYVTASGESMTRYKSMAPGGHAFALTSGIRGWFGLQAGIVFY